jgi:hypothetical protein
MRTKKSLIVCESEQSPFAAKASPIETTRKNVGDGGYHGCLRIEVRRGTRLYGRIEGWATAVMAHPTGDEGQVSNPAS